jgi:hypothetical protein
MSQENLAVVRRFIRECEVNRDELPAIVADLWDPDCNYYPAPKFPEAVPRHGREQLARFMAQFHETWVRFENPIKELIAVGDDRVLVWATMRAEGPGSGIRLEGDVYNCVWLRHGRILRWEDHLTLKGALQALGLDGATLEDAGLAE